MYISVSYNRIFIPCSLEPPKWIFCGSLCGLLLKIIKTQQHHWCCFAFFTNAVTPARSITVKGVSEAKLVSLLYKASPGSPQRGRVRPSSFTDYVNTDVQSRKMYTPILFLKPFLVLYKPLSMKGSKQRWAFCSWTPMLCWRLMGSILAKPKSRPGKGILKSLKYITYLHMFYMSWQQTLAML